MCFECENVETSIAALLSGAQCGSWWEVGSHDARARSTIPTTGFTAQSKRQLGPWILYTMTGGCAAERIAAHRNHVLWYQDVSVVSRPSRQRKCFIQRVLPQFQFPAKASPFKKGPPSFYETRPTRESWGPHHLDGRQSCCCFFSEAW